MARLIRAKDWSQSPLGAIEDWPQSLKTTVSLCLASNFPINIIWGSSHTQIYNDGYKILCGDVHPAALGEAYTKTWASAWPAIGEPFARALAGETSYLENQRMFLTRNGYLEETFFTFSTSPIHDESGGIGGLFHPVTETTRAMLAERRTRALCDLNAAFADARTTEAVFAAAISVLSRFGRDLPVVAVYRLDGSGNTYTRFGEQNQTGNPLFPACLGDWPTELNSAGAVARVPLPIHSDDAPAYVRDANRDVDKHGPMMASVLPIHLPGRPSPDALVFAGISANLPFDAAYRDFHDLLGSAIAGAVADARTYEEERQRAEAMTRLHRAKTVFFSNVSHEFRTPLTLMLGPLEDVLQDGEALPSLQRERLSIAHRNALRLLKLVNSLLDFSRLEAGRSRATFVATDLAAFTSELANGFQDVCNRAGLALHVDCPPLPFLVCIDSDMWENIILNLLSNAVKFTLQGSITVSIRPSGDAHAELVVADTGVGIPPDELPHVFERFHRIEGQRGRTHEGTGIGLALASEFVGLHGGTIAATSCVDRGSEFRVTLPIGDTDRADVERPDTGKRLHAFLDEASRWLPAPALGGHHAVAEEEPSTAPLARVLLADDNADMRAYVGRILREGGYEVEAVENGRAALAAVERNPPDLVLTDVMMPELDGFGLLRAVRSRPRLEDVRLILLSARAGDEARIEGLRSGADDYLIKPFSARELRARVDGAVNLGRQRREAAGRERDLILAASAEREASAAQLHQLQKIEAIGQLTAGIAHDINNLLTPLFGAVEILNGMLSGDKRAARIAALAFQAGDRAKTLITRLLAFGRKQPLYKRPTDIARLVEGLVEDLLKHSIGTEIAVHMQFAANLPAAMVDPNQLELAILNLALNARDAMPSGGNLTIAAVGDHVDGARASGLACGDYVRLSVADDGVGMDERTAKRAVEPFFTTKAMGEGTGLGLSMVHGLTAQLGGGMAIATAPGRGTRVDLWFPVATIEAPAGVDDRAVVERTAASRDTTVMLVDDEVLVRTIAADMLRTAGYEVVEAASGIEARRLVEKGVSFDVLVTDQLMPLMKGTELAMELRKARPELPVLVVSGYDDPANAVFRSLAKPFTSKSLVESVTEAIAASDPASGSRSLTSARSWVGVGRAAAEP